MKLFNPFPDTPQMRVTQNEHATVVEMRHYDGSFYYGLFKSLAGVEYSIEFMRKLRFALDLYPDERAKFEFFPRPQDLPRLEPRLVKSLAIAQTNLIATLPLGHAEELLEMLEHSCGEDTVEHFGCLEDSELSKQIFESRYDGECQIEIVHKDDLSLVKVEDNQGIISYGIFKSLKGLIDSHDCAKAIGDEISNSQIMTRPFDLLETTYPDSDPEYCKVMALAQSQFIATLSHNQALSVFEFLDEFQLSR